MQCRIRRERKSGTGPSAPPSPRIVHVAVSVIGGGREPPLERGCWGEDAGSQVGQCDARELVPEADAEGELGAGSVARGGTKVDQLDSGPVTGEGLELGL